MMRNQEIAEEMFSISIGWRRPDIDDPLHGHAVYVMSRGASNAVEPVAKAFEHFLANESPSSALQATLLNSLVPAVFRGLVSPLQWLSIEAFGQVLLKQAATAFEAAQKVWDFTLKEEGVAMAATKVAEAKTTWGEPDWKVLDRFADKCRDSTFWINESDLGCFSCFVPGIVVGCSLHRKCSEFQVVSRAVLPTYRRNNLSRR
jgi:hypothetical protein